MYQFKENDVICFFGDSITNRGKMMRRIYQYYREVLNIKCEMLNCGVSGDNAGNGYTRIEESVMIYSPNVVVIAFGMNDVNMDLYITDVLTEEQGKLRRDAIDETIANIEKCIQYFKDRNIEVIITTPTVYDEFSEVETPAKSGVMGALREVSERIRALPEKYDVSVIDLYNDFFDTMKKLYKEGKMCVSTDRVHPDDIGYEIMTQSFLRGQGFDVEFKQDFASLEALSQRPYDEWEEKRYELEVEAKGADYVILKACRYFTDEEILKKAEEIFETCENAFIVNCFKNYIRMGKDVDRLRKELKEYTSTITNT